MAFVEAEARRVRCPEHGVVVAAVPWARHRSSFTRAFEDQAAWLVVRTDKTTLSSLLRIAWRTVGAIIERVSAERAKLLDPLAELHRIGVDEISYRKGHRYLTIVVDHDSGRLVWAMPGRDAQTLEQFFDALGPERCGKIQLVSADAASWIKTVVAARCPSATLCLDPFHIVQWATDALDQVRRDVWNELRRSGAEELAKSLKNSRYALWKNPEDLTDLQSAKLADIQRTNQPLYRAYLMKEQLREVFKMKGWLGLVMLDKWISWAQRSRLAPFVKLAKSIRKHRYDIQSALLHGLSNARLEAANTKLRLLHRLAFGFHSPRPLIALAMLKLGGLCPPLPWLS
jgi:transposase